MAPTVDLVGELGYIKFDKNGFRIAEMTPVDPPELLAQYAPGMGLPPSPLPIKGKFDNVEMGQRATFTGYFIKDPKWGIQFNVQRAIISPEALQDSLVEALASPLFEGVGETLAQRIVDTFGEATETILETDPQALAQVQGISPTLADSIHETWLEEAGFIRLVRLCVKTGISKRIAKALFEEFGEGAMDYMHRTPYELIRRWGVTWQEADEVGKHFEVPPHDRGRMEGAFRHVMNTIAANKAHTMVPEATFVAEATKVLGLPHDEVAKGMHQAISTMLYNIVNEHGSYVSTDDFVQAEQRIATSLAKRLDMPVRLGFSGKGIQTWLNDEQHLGVERAFSSRVSFITGGPGTGKTTAVKNIADICKAEQLNVALVAPTGRAAKRLAELTGSPASTVHRLLAASESMAPFIIQCEANAHNPLELDLVVCDEWSMADIFLADALLQALPLSAHIVFVGDADQLPSIGPGNVTADIIAGGIPVTELIYNHRQAAGSTIVDLAADIRNQAILTPISLYQGDVTMLACDHGQLVDEVVHLMVDELPSRLDVTMDDIQIITASNVKQAGVRPINEAIKAIVNPVTDHPGATYRKFSPGDRIMVLQNNYDLGVSNGDVGRVTKVNPTAKRITCAIDGELVDFEKDDVDMLTHAWAMTVHKSQGGEWPVIILVLDKDVSFMYTKHLVYTACTRAAQHLVVVGNIDGLKRSVEGRGEDPRHTLLGSLLGQALGHPLEDAKTIKHGPATR